MILPGQVEIRSVEGGVVSLPRVALGCGSFGGLGSQPHLFGQGMSDDEAAALMDAAWALGISHFDTADAYGGGRSESAIGRWMSSRGVRPTLTTKTFNPMAAGADRGLAPARIARQLPTSLERLGVDHVELYLAHDYDPAVPVQDTLDALESLRTAGLIDAYGVSNFDAAQLARAAAVAHPAAVQNEYSLLHRDDEATVIPLCAELAVAYLVYSPLSGGWLTGKYRRGSGYPADSRMSQFPDPYERLASDSTFSALKRFEDDAGALGRSMAGLALGWLLADDRIAQIVVGPARPEHLAPVAEALAEPLTAERRDAISAIFAT